MTTGNVAVTEGSGKNAATYTFSEDAITKFLQRLVLSDSAGVEQNALGVTTGAKVITDANGTMQQYLRGLVYLLITGGQAQLSTLGYFATIGTNFSRPADTTAYAADDAVTDSTTAPTILTFTNAARVSGGSGIITDAILIDESNPGTKGSFELMLYDTTFTPNNDNAAFAPSTTVARTFLGKISFSTVSNSGTSDQHYHAQNVNLAFTAVGSANIFGELVARNAYTPASSGRFDIRLKILQLT